MEKASRNCDIWRRGDLLAVDERSWGRLSREIAAAQREGIAVSVGERRDPAYDSPEEIERVYGELSLADSFVEEARRREMGKLAQWAQYVLSGDFTKESWKTRVNRSSAVEKARRDHLYGPDRTDAEAWWRQGGGAMALATIVFAHQLAEPGEHGYQTMSGPIGPGILRRHFGDNVPELSGLSLRSAVGVMAQNFGAVRGLFELSPAEREQRSAEKLEKLERFVTAQNTAEFLDVIRYCSDGIGIRERMQTVNDEIIEFLEQDNQSTCPVIMSLGCGTAIPMLDLIHQLKERGKSPLLVAVDQDPIALAAARLEARRLGVSDMVELHCDRLFDKLGRPVDLAHYLQGRIPTVVENSGLREYVPDIAYNRLLKEIYGVLGADGLAVNCATNKNRPHAGFLYGAMGWPVNIRRHGIKEMVGALEKAGFAGADTQARVVASGVYTCYFSHKP